MHPSAHTPDSPGLLGLFFAAVVFVSCAATVPGAETVQEPSPPSSDPLAGWGEILQLSPDIFVAVTRPWNSNSLVVEVDDGTLVMVDTPVTPSATRALLRWMRARFGKRRIVAINSHYHIDCLGGNEVLAGRGIETIGVDMTAGLLARRGAAMMDQVAEAFEGEPEMQHEIKQIRLTPPTTTFSAGEGMTLRFGNERVRVIYPGPGHTPDNVVVHFPGQAVTFGGCLIKDGDQLGNVAEADLAHWPAAAAVVAALKHRWVVPGHGKRFSPSIVDGTIKLVRANNRRIAVTIDDLPVVGKRTLSPAGIVDSIVRGIQEAGVPVVGFVAAARGHLAALESWKKNNLPLGNHTFSHRRFSRVKTAEYLADIRRNETVVRQQLGVKLEGGFFRHPFLDHGRTEEKVRAAGTFLASRNYKLAPVSLDTVDYRFSDHFVESSDPGAVLKMYLQHLNESARHFEGLSKRLYGRTIPMILLLHANELNARHLPEALAVFRKRGYRFIELGEALEDRSYADLGPRPPLVPSRGDRNFLNQVAMARGIETTDPSGDAHFDSYWQPRLAKIGKKGVQTTP